jgi:nitrogen fixation protein FixH
MTRRFTGWHMTAIMVAFFAVVIVVNFVMARDAVRTFGGEIVENSYVASQRYNHWLTQAHAQERAGWTAAPSVDAKGHLAIAVAQAGANVSGAQVTVTARHPLGRVPDRSISLAWDSARQLYVARGALPHGRWLLRIAVQMAGVDARFEDEVHT